jgi:diguanylate cyclase (GGDEF)-like protein
MELLLADGTRTALSRFAEHPNSGAPGCGVETLAGCVAVRRGSVTEFADSDALNACPRLRNRACGSVSAVCVPLSFMGRSFGVLHAAGMPRKPLAAQKIAQLTALGAQAGNRIGTLRAFAQTYRQAKTDELTGIGNRRAVEEAIHELRLSETKYAFALADLDRFKQLNDTHGHAAGDRALCIFADVIRRCVRDGDCVGRWGGEEFALAFKGARASEALEVIERIRQKLAEELLATGGPAFTASFGIADSGMHNSFESLQRMADEALYASKSAGRDRAAIYAEGLQVKLAPVSVAAQIDGTDRQRRAL